MKRHVDGVPCRTPRKYERIKTGHNDHRDLTLVSIKERAELFKRPNPPAYTGRRFVRFDRWRSATTSAVGASRSPKKFTAIWTNNTNITLHNLIRHYDINSAIISIRVYGEYRGGRAVFRKLKRVRNRLEIQYKKGTLVFIMVARCRPPKGFFRRCRQTLTAVFDITLEARLFISPCSGFILLVLLTVVRLRHASTKHIIPYVLLQRCVRFERETRLQKLAVSVRCA